MDDNNGITEELIQEILANSKILLNITNTEKDNLLTLYIISLCNNILIKTNRKVFPKELKYIVANLVVDKFNFDLPDKDLQQIQRIEEYDRQVEFQVPDVTRARLEIMAKKQLEEYDSLINKYKLLYRVTLKQEEKDGDSNEQN